MSERRLFPEFRDQYETTLYPFMDTATLTSTGSGQTIDRDIFLDASIYPVGVVGPVHLSGISVQPQEVRVTISGRVQRDIARGTFNPADVPECIGLFDAWGRAAGILVSTPDRLSRLIAWPSGDHVFAQTATTFVPGCVIPTPEVGVRGILLESGELLTGDILIVGEDGVVVRQTAPGVLRVDVVGDPLFRRKLCAGADLFVAPRFIRTINGCPPDVNGNFNITVGGHINDETVIRINRSDNGLVIGAVGT